MERIEAMTFSFLCPYCLKDMHVNRHYHTSMRQSARRSISQHWRDCPRLPPGLKVNAYEKSQALDRAVEGLA